MTIKGASGTSPVEQKRAARLMRKAYNHVRAGYAKLADLEDRLEEAREDLNDALAVLAVMDMAEEEGEEEEDSPSFPRREPGERRWYDGDEDPDSALG